MDMVGCDDVVENAQLVTPASLKQPIHPASSVNRIPQQEIFVVAALRDVPYLSGHEVPMGSSHDVPSWNVYRPRS